MGARRYICGVGLHDCTSNNPPKISSFSPNGRTSSSFPLDWVRPSTLRQTEKEWAALLDVVALSLSAGTHQSLICWANKPIHSFLVGYLNPCLQGISVWVGLSQPQPFTQRRWKTNPVNPLILYYVTLFSFFFFPIFWSSFGFGISIMSPKWGLTYVLMPSKLWGLGFEFLLIIKNIKRVLVLSFEFDRV